MCKCKKTFTIPLGSLACRSNPARVKMNTPPVPLTLKQRTSSDVIGEEIRSVPPSSRNSPTASKINTPPLGQVLAETSGTPQPALDTEKTSGEATGQEGAAKKTAKKRKSRKGKRSKRSKGGLDKDDIVYGPQHVIMLFVPVTICMCVVVICSNWIDVYSKQGQGGQLDSAMEDPEAPTETKMLASAIAALSFLVFIMLTTTCVVVLYKYRCYKLIGGWLIMASVMLVFVLSFQLLREIMVTLNYPLDYVTSVIFIWNFGVAGMMAIHWKAPLLLQQGYLICVSTLVALTLISVLPEWVANFILAVLVIWDLVAVLAPMGPLRLLVETAQNRNEQLFPALIYSSTMMWEIMAVDPDDTDEIKPDKEQDKGGAVDVTVSARPVKCTTFDLGSNKFLPGSESPFLSSAQESEVDVPKATHKEEEKKESEDDDDEDRGIKLGLGDFIFYAVLVGKASTSGEWTTTIACIVAILMGLCFTLALLAIFRTALPALPISLTFGLVFKLTATYLVTPFTDQLAAQQIFV